MDGCGLVFALTLTLITQIRDIESILQTRILQSMRFAIFDTPSVL
jgi:hypothetical protein